MKHEWKKNEKNIYCPARIPELINIPTYPYFTIRGKGDPNGVFFAEYIAVLYSLSYAVKMSSKHGFSPDSYYDYTVYPLEGVWDIEDHAKTIFTGTVDKNSLVFHLMIRQPSFVDKVFAQEIIQRTQKRKPHHLLPLVNFDHIEDGQCIQMTHVGTYDDESKSFQKMERFAVENNFMRVDESHREIYLSDARKTVPEKLNTVLRFRVKPI